MGGVDTPTTGRGHEQGLTSGRRSGMIPGVADSERDDWLSLMGAEHPPDGSRPRLPSRADIEQEARLALLEADVSGRVSSSPPGLDGK